MVIKNVNLEIVCGVTSKVPDTAYAEVAFAGKSNVGKSSLINALMNRKALARTSAAIFSKVSFLVWISSVKSFTFSLYSSYLPASFTILFTLFEASAPM